ncbi:hypothetical protein PSV09DRAFT_2422288 [Bipolaris maydis]|nr:hypothetical protein J3E74DRAFT_455445 [Bipolaris maydis]KAJ6209007.1 hypothetical protein PSV09DRAFT_2422288 [Bipolaris maydis]
MAGSPGSSSQAKSWKIALEQHKENYISLVTERWPLFDWICQLLGRVPPNQVDIGYRISLAEMHRMYMRALQIELVKIGVALQFDNKDENTSEEGKLRMKNAEMTLEPALAKYSTNTFTLNTNEKLTIGNLAQAVRDYEYMMTSSRAYDYFIVSSERVYDGDIIRQNLRDRPDYEEAIANLYAKEINSALPTGPWECLDKNSRANPIGRTRNDSIKSLLRHNFWGKLSAAIVGSGFLVGPMWLLALKQHLYLQLEATTGFVFMFGLILAYFVDKVDQVFAGALAYAAVLMVFVGLSIQGADTG